jgi:hypothetical protein
METSAAPDIKMARLGNPSFEQLAINDLDLQVIRRSILCR